jgi:hypothetical protein
MYPKFLTPTEVELFIVDNQSIEIPKCIMMFKKWTGQPMKERFGGKPIVCINNKPMFAELAITNLFISGGWQARWICTYGKSNMQPIYLTEWKDDKFKNQIHKPIADNNINKLLAEITNQNRNSFSGCWDVLAWKKTTVLFAESKRKKKDSIRITQTNWLRAGLKYGLCPNNFLIVQWDI